MPTFEAGRPPEARFARGRAVLTVDLGALQANYRHLVREAAPAAAVAGVVKADGYGLGAAAVAPALWAAGCRTFFVAHLDEALGLRALLPQDDVTVGVLNGLTASDPAAFVAHRLLPVLNHPGELRTWADLARRRGERLPAALHVDTGMRRLGFGAAEVGAIDRGALEAIELRLVMSHLACAEEPDHPLNRLQIERFEALRRRLPAGTPASLANSSGIFLGAAARLDLCRPGVALYGVNPTPGRPNPMRPVVSLHAPVLQVHEIDEPGGGVGYGATYPTRPGARVATVPVGYADGVPRRAGNRAVARIAGREVPVAGWVSMDLMTLDVTGLPEGAVGPGTPVELIGGPDGIDRLAAAAETIGYEVLTRLGARFERRHLPAADLSDEAAA